MIIGAGLAGAISAYTLSRTGLAVALVRNEGPRYELGESLPPLANRYLQDLGLAEIVRESGSMPSYGTRSAWGTSQLLERNFITDADGHGWHLNKWALVNRLQEAACSEGALIIGAANATFEILKGGWKVLINDQPPDGSVRGHYLIDATGRPSRQTKAKYLTYDWLVAAVGILAASAWRGEHFTYVEAFEWGWWFANPMPNGQVAIALLTDSDVARRLKIAQPGVWRQLLMQTSHITDAVSDMRFVGQGIRILPATSIRVECPVRSYFYVIGDAAGTYDPISALGITSILAASEKLVKVISSENNEEGTSTYREWFHTHYSSYLARWVGTYDTERRWPQSAFWSRRHAVAAALKTPSNRQLSAGI